MFNITKKDSSISRSFRNSIGPKLNLRKTCRRRSLRSLLTSYVRSIDVQGIMTKIILNFESVNTVVEFETKS